MDARQFDTLTRVISFPGSRRCLLALLATIPLVAGLAAILAPEDAEAKERRRRRKQRHKKRKKPGNRKRKHGCKPKGKGKVCAGKCGPVTSRQTCGKAVDCGSCDCTPACEACFTCQGAAGAPGTCVPQPGALCGAATCESGTLQPPGSCDGSGVCQPADPVSCAPYTRCEGNACATRCTGDDDCVAGDICCDDACVDGQTDDANCGACGHACGAGQTCQGGVCGVECGSDFCPSASEICITNACAPCDVTCTGNPAECGTALQATLNGTRATLHVCPGRYQGGFSIDRHVTVIGAGQGEDDRVDTILDGNDTQRVLLLTSGVVMLQGLHVTRGNAGSIVGGGINNDGATLIMQDCTVSHSACRLGGGINHQGGVLTMTRCTLRDNDAQTDGAGGGGLRLLRQATLTDCLVTGNTCDGTGGGIDVSTGLASQTVTLAGTTRIEGNTAHQGGGLFTSDTNVTIGADCRITGNTATLAGEGGGITRLSGTVTLEGTADPSPIVTGNCPENCAGAVPKCQAGGVCPATP